MIWVLESKEDVSVEGMCVLGIAVGLADGRDYLWKDFWFLLV